MRIAFVFAPYRHKRFSENLRVVDEDFGRFPPVNLAYAAAIAEQAGHRVTMVDAHAEGLDVQATLDRLAPFRPEAIGFYFSTYMFHDTLAWARQLRHALRVPIVAGGINLQLYPRESMAHESIDYAVVGPAIRALPALLAAIESGTEPDIPGVCYRRRGEVVCHSPDRHHPPFEHYPFPARHLLPNDRYYSITSQRRNFTVMVTSLGCHQRCSFCAIAPLPVDSRSAHSVLEEMALAERRYGVREVDIFDADFAFHRDRLEAICHGIRERALGIEWSCRACIDSIDGPLLERMARAGCRRIYLGIETANEEALREVNKRLTVERVGEVIAAAQRSGIRPLGFFMTGLPGETRASLLRTLRLALRLDLDYAQFSRTVAKPGSLLHRQWVRRAGRDYWRDYVLGEEVERRMGSPWTRLSEAEIERWTEIAYLAFYFRPSRVLRSVRRSHSLEELGRGLRTAARMARGSLRRG